MKEPKIFVGAVMYGGGGGGGGTKKARRSHVVSDLARESTQTLYNYIYGDDFIANEVAGLAVRRVMAEHDRIDKQYLRRGAYILFGFFLAGIVIGLAWLVGRMV